MKILIIGGGAAGSSCATRLRRLNEDAEILILEKTGENSIANCGLPYYIGDIIQHRDKIEVAKPSLFKNLFNIQIKHHTEVTALLPDKKQIRTQQDEIYIYDKLVISTGAKPFIPDIKGIENMPIFTLKSLESADNMKNFIQINHPKSALVLGAGFIGIEVAENLKKLGIKVSLVDSADQILVSQDKDMVLQIQKHLQINGVNLFLSTTVRELTKTKAILSTGENIRVDMVVLAVGTKPETSFLKETGIKIDENGLIYTNEYMQTHLPDVYACGDCVLVKDFILETHQKKELAGPANRQGRLIADNIMGHRYPYKGTQGTGIIKVFDLTMAFTGASEKQLKAENIPYQKMIVTGLSHAGYYPEAKDITLKVLYNKEGKILGASCVGEEGVDKRIDVLATMIRLKGRVQDLRDAELCYAPPYSSAKDIINLMGMAIENAQRGLVTPYFGNDFDDMFVLDVRPSHMYQNEHIKGAVNIPFMEIRKKINELPKDKPIMIHCVKGYTSYVIARYLMQKGFKTVFSYAGGWLYYKTIQNDKK